MSVSSARSRCCGDPRSDDQLGPRVCVPVPRPSGWGVLASPQDRVHLATRDPPMCARGSEGAYLVEHPPKRSDYSQEVEGNANEVGGGFRR